MRGAGQARVERVDGPQDLDRPLRIGHRRTDQRGFVGAALSLGRPSARRSRCSAPRSDNWRFCRRECGPSGPARRAELLRCRSPCSRPARSWAPTWWCRRWRMSPALRLAISRSYSSSSHLARQPGFESARSRAAERREQRRRLQLQPSQSLGDDFLELVAAAGEADQHAGQRTDFHRVALPARRFHPRVPAVLIELLIRRLGTGVAGLGVVPPKDAARSCRPDTCTRSAPPLPESEQCR